jgi:hypothetical protein
MPEPSGHTLLTDALRVIGQAIEAHADVSPWREIVARTSARERRRKTFAVAIYEGDPEHVVDHYVIRVHEGRFEAVERGRSEPAVDWRVSVDSLRHIVAEPDRYLDAPEKLDLGWLQTRLGIGRARSPSPTWRIGRAHRPK